jgi:hypothetical protein
MSEIIILLRPAEVRCKIGEKTTSYEASADLFCGVEGREFRRELAGSVELTRESSRGSPPVLWSQRERIREGVGRYCGFDGREFRD